MNVHLFHGCSISHYTLRACYRGSLSGFPQLFLPRSAACFAFSSYPLIFDRAFLVCRDFVGLFQVSAVLYIRSSTLLLESHILSQSVMLVHPRLTLFCCLGRFSTPYGTTALTCIQRNQAWDEESPIVLEDEDFQSCEDETGDKDPKPEWNSHLFFCLGTRCGHSYNRTCPRSFVYKLVDMYMFAMKIWGVFPYIHCSHVNKTERKKSWIKKNRIQSFLLFFLNRFLFIPVELTFQIIFFCPANVQHERPVMR